MLYIIFTLCLLFIVSKVCIFIVIEEQRIIVVSILNTIHGYASEAFTRWEKILVYLWLFFVPKRARAMHYNLRLGMKVRSAYEKAYMGNK